MIHLLLLLATPVDPIFVELRLGQTRAEVERTFSVAPRWLDATAPQALREGLIDSGLLETLSRFGAAPRHPEHGLALDRYLGFALAEQGGRRYAMIFEASPKGPVLGAVLVTTPVPVKATADPAEGWSPNRLAPLHGTRALYPGLSPAERDSYGNIITWRGNAFGGALRAWYRPDLDQVRLLLYR